MSRMRSLQIVAVALILAAAGLVTVDSFGQAKAKDTIVMKGGPLGSVTFEHKAHEGYSANKCETCHHASKPEKAGAAPQQACSTCHVTPQKPPMKTNKMAAFHNMAGSTGTCVDCHKTENAKGKKAPMKCVDCHKKG
ncbi:MAG TPA: cytochrome c3 family protein [Candidatus Acidoferrales bacterium]